MTRTILDKLIGALAAAACIVFSQAAMATPWAPTANPPGNVSPTPSATVPIPDVVPGKTFSDNVDRDASGTADPEQNVQWDGVGGTSDGRDYGGDGEVDAIANGGDALFSDVITNQASLLFSVSGDSNIYVEDLSGGFATWATAPLIDNMNTVSDVDGLEVWGPEGAGVGSDDSDHFSLVGAGGTVVFEADGTPAWLASDLVGPLGVLTGEEILSSHVDIDGMMLSGASIMFSLAPVDLLFDGGEIFLLNAAGGLSYLSHGGHLWDTAFDVMGTFNLASENVNALEAVPGRAVVVDVPEPGALFLLGLGLLGMGLRSRMR